MSTSRAVVLQSAEYCRYPATAPWRSPLTDHCVRKIVDRAGKLAGFEFPTHPHLLRHSCEYYLASKGWDTQLIQD